MSIILSIYSKNVNSLTNFLKFFYNLKKKNFYDPISYCLFNFKNFFNKNFKYNLQNKQRLSFYYGKLRRNYLKRIVKLILKESKNLNIRAPILFIQKLETRFDTALYRTHFCHSFYNISQLISHQKIYVEQFYY